MSVSLLGMSLAFAVAGVLQSYLERAQGQPYMVAQQPIRFWMFIAFVHGIGVLAGASMSIVHLLTLKPAARAAPALGGAGLP
jgi:nitric oxide reductase subunit B